ncbi:hypothetical protein CBR_g17932 [Chara braunii]|uniref:USP domain-containing protein n=1 Tax=Chara braunii TaxID=69332 RepID=A0A388KVY0_CHABU|nr:hypothetical protein CBR_g17932 [Chara braunii]|eukprot:GBG74219.1 hypothetical protein CBR_g17932 [Chara braunii]
MKPGYIERVWDTVGALEFRMRDRKVELELTIRDWKVDWKSGAPDQNVYSYAEDDTVEDPFLAEHIAHFGINFTALEKTEMTTAEKELDQNLNFDWFRIQEKGKELEPLFGPGYTGLANLGNSCYLASVMQVVFSTRDFQERYFNNLPLRDAFNNALADPTLDIVAQLAKLAHGLLSGKYSVPSVEASSKEAAEGESVMQAQEGIPPRMFKTLIGTGHPEFSSGRQQDALEFFQHLLDVVERTDSGRSVDPSKCFRFLVEERIQCAASANVKYNYRADNVLSLGIPLDAAVNKEEVEEYNRKQAEKAAAGEKMDGAAVRPRVPLSACLEAFSAEEEVADFYSSSIGGKTTAIKRTRLRTFPDCLVLHMKKFVHDVGWVAKKLDVFIDVPDEIDLSHLRGKGLQPGEQELPDTPDVDTPIRSSSGGGPSVENSTVPVDEESLGMLTAIGCSKEVARRALQETVIEK